MAEIGVVNGCLGSPKTRAPNTSDFLRSIHVYTLTHWLVSSSRKYMGRCLLFF